ncbi:M15 family metallopeptidase [Thalassolituus sp. C2-1]|uniref:M15 family metallopeptidase n=1 Tax=Venatorbacter sp. C2-1 TaxID=2597518 RepID=UPI00118F17AE|nr:M15 family metallopeptidase [Thalassolituus sp. C2-1]TVV43157.1 M15 family metallopeptidase [Thalassolituus sp. C2-1]
MPQPQNGNSSANHQPPLSAHELRPSFVRLDQHIPDILIDLKYAGCDNFIGAVVDGYQQACALLSRPAAEALANVAAELRQQNLRLKIFDAYRPQRAVDHFLRWASRAEDFRTKDRFYPSLEKPQLFEQGYLFSHSSHSRGSTADLTLVDSDGRELDMGTIFDFFGPQSWPESADVSPVQRANRDLLQSVMRRHGFTGVREEWWHFTLGDEPYPDQYFDFLPTAEYTEE